ncbi:MAG: beta-L-arabinofuranosidase domain-containing protein [Spirochaetia bacterium]|jgi:hypothetical protein
MLDALPPGAVRLGGKIGRRIDATIQNNILAVGVDGDFLAPYRKRDAESAYIGLGHFLDAVTRLAASRGDPALEDLRSRILSALVETQEPNGYMGLFPEARRLSHLWDTHETSHMIYGLATDHRYRPQGPSLELARGLAGWIMSAWRAEPDRPARQFVMATLDLEPALLNSRCIAQLTLMRWRPSLGLTRATERALEYMLHGDGMMITGEVGDHECRRPC